MMKMYKRPKYEWWRGKSGWFFHLVASNGKIVSPSEEYSSKDAVLRGIKAHREAARTTRVREKIV